jgi:amidase
VADAAVVYEAIAGFDPNDPTSLADPVPNMLKELDRGLKGAQIGFDRDYATKGVDPGLVASIGIALGVLEELGAEIVDVNIPEFGETHVNSWFEICAYEACRAHAANYPARADDYGPYFRDFLGFGSEVSDEAYSQASQLRAEFNAQFIAVLSAVDAVACPGGGVPFPVSAEIQYGDMANFDPTMQNIQMQHTVPADFAGTPTISLPCGTNEDGIPYTFQFLGAHLTESRLCQIAHAYEEATEWHARCPPV